MSVLEKARQQMQRFDRLSVRDRVAFGVAIATVIVFLVTITLIAPDTVRRKQTIAKVTAQKNEIVGMQVRLGELTKQLEDDPVVQKQKARDELKRQIEETDAQLAQVAQTAPRMGSLVREMLASTPGVSLESIKTLPVVPVIQPAARAPSAAPGGGAAATQESAVYRHGIEVSLRGNYLAFLPYLERLQKSSSQLTWADARVEVTSYPESKLTFTLFTLSGQPSPSLG